MAHDSSLAIAIAELINRLSPDEQAELAAHLSIEQIQSLESFKRAHTNGWSEPEIYIEIGRDHISFETPLDKVRPFLLRLYELLQPQQVEMRLSYGGESLTLENKRRFNSQLELLADVIANEPVVIELDEQTLYSNGGGCMMLKTTADDLFKQRIAQAFLDVCGVAAQVNSNHFIAWVEHGHLEILS